MSSDVKKEGINIDTNGSKELAANAAKMQPDPPRGRGYGRPFQPGQSGNPAGKVPGTRNFNSIVTEALKKMGAKDTQGNPLPIEDALVQKIVKMALEGDRKMIEMIWNYRDGKPPQNIDVTSKGERVGTVIISAEEEQRIEELFAPRKLLEPVKQNGNDTKPSNDGSNRSGDNGGLAVPQGEQPGGAYEGNA